MLYLVLCSFPHTLFSRLNRVQMQELVQAESDEEEEAGAEIGEPVEAAPGSFRFQLL
jgi:hypothetical protein